MMLRSVRIRPHSFLLTTIGVTFLTYRHATAFLAIDRVKSARQIGHHPPQSRSRSQPDQNKIKWHLCGWGGRIMLWGFQQDDEGNNYSEQQQYDDGVDYDEEFVFPLDLKMEEQLRLRQEPPIATITWFRLKEHESTEATVQFLRERAWEILQSNPWLEGRLQNKGKELVVQRANPYTVNLERFVQLTSTKDSQYLVKHKDTPHLYFKKTKKYTQINNFPNLQTPPSYKGLWRITIVPSYGSFALILSISHWIADSHTYYKIYDMLTSQLAPQNSYNNGYNNYNNNNNGNDDDNDIPPLVYSMDVATPEDSDEQAQYLVGGPRVWKMIHSPWLLLKGAVGTVQMKAIRPLWETTAPSWRRKGKTGSEYWFEVDLLEIERLKMLLMDDDDDVSQMHFSSKGNTFVSTNDILSAWFLQATRCRMGLIGFDYRGRMGDDDNHHEYLARNYWGTYALTPDQFQSPQAIRQHLKNPMVSKQFPTSAAELLNKPIGIVSSWTKYGRRRKSSGNPNNLYGMRLQQQVEQLQQQQQQDPQDRVTTIYPVESHWPLYDFANHCPANFVVLRTWWIERPTKENEDGRMGVYVAGDANWLREIESGYFPSFLYEIDYEIDGKGGVGGGGLMYSYDQVDIDEDNLTMYDDEDLMDDDAAYHRSRGGPDDISPPYY